MMPNDFHQDPSEENWSGGGLPEENREAESERSFCVAGSCTQELENLKSLPGRSSNAANHTKRRLSPADASVPACGPVEEDLHAVGIRAARALGVETFQNDAGRVSPVVMMVGRCGAPWRTFAPLFWK
mmetsp:Transcript_7082/g.16196  ORF Transcript_7082/g.16196 Transcript_7082/m.16196 type:complete len:128 (-) Transcript_7082:1412-1795(-)